ncbi:MAG: hypothetical protein Q8S00_23575 [Deltaproteobacteria bacterium]|nr:hypothetical protein [Deltaproteobacteria bacterium]
MVLLVLGGVMVVVLWALACLPGLRAVGLLLSVEGTVLWASALTPVGMTPPPGGFLGLFRWLFAGQGGVTFAINQPIFYVGVLLAIAGTVVSSVAG